jgi:N-methylhydantoinase A
MVVAPPVVDVSQTVVHLGSQLDDARLAAECGRLNLLASERLGDAELASVEVYADVRFRGQSHELKVRVRRPALAEIEDTFRAAYETTYGGCPTGRAVEIVTLRLRRLGHAARLSLPNVERDDDGARRSVLLYDAEGNARAAPALARGALIGQAFTGPLLVIDAEATTYVPEGWSSEGGPNGTILLTHTH